MAQCSFVLNEVQSHNINFNSQYNLPFSVVLYVGGSCVTLDAKSEIWSVESRAERRNNLEKRLMQQFYRNTTAELVPLRADISSAENV